MQSRSEGQDEDERMQTRPAAPSQGLGGPLATAVSPGDQDVRAPRIEGSRHESVNADAQENVIPARRPEEGAGGHGALEREARNVDMNIIQAGILSRLAQVEKAVQGHGNLISAWQSEEEHGDVPHAGVPQETQQDMQQTISTGQQGGTMSAGAPQRSAAVEGPLQMQPAVQAS